MTPIIIMSQRAGRSKRPYGHKQDQRNPILPRELDDDLPEIQRLAADYYKVVDEQTRQILVNFVFDGKSLEYYHGSYTAWYQAFVLDNQTEEKNMAPVLGGMVHALAAKIVETLAAEADRLKKEFQ